MPVAAILDAIDYRPDLGPAECGRLAAALGLNEVGLCALASGKYPLPDSEGLPFRLWPLRVVARHRRRERVRRRGERGRPRAPLRHGPRRRRPRAVWPHAVRGIDAIFITHVEAEHAGGLPRACGGLGVSRAYIPAGRRTPPGGCRWGRGRRSRVGALARHGVPDAGPLRDAQLLPRPLGRGAVGAVAPHLGRPRLRGSAGGPYHCQRQLRAHLRRVLAAVPADTVVAPGPRADDDGGQRAPLQSLRLLRRPALGLVDDHDDDGRVVGAAAVDGQADDAAGDRARVLAARRAAGRAPARRSGGSPRRCRR